LSETLSFHQYAPTSSDDYLTRILPIITYNNSELQALYAPSQFNGNYSQAYVALLSQGYFICAARRMAGYMSGQSTYLYTYTHTPEYYLLTLPQLVVWPGAYNSAELYSLFQILAPTLYGNSIFTSDELSLATSLRQYWTNMITTGQPNNNVSSTWPQYSSNSDQVLVLNINTINTSFIGMYPNCDLFSEVQVNVFGQYLGFNATCTVGNKCFIVNSTTTTGSAANHNNLRYCQLNFLFLLCLYILLLF
jgi:carboxylesterase type B